MRIRVQDNPQFLFLLPPCRAIIQRASSASINIDHAQGGSIARGLVVLLGIHQDDTPKDSEWLLRKLLNLRIFDDAGGKPNLSVQDIAGDLLIVSQFTLHANTKKGNRPSYNTAAKPDVAIPLYETFLKDLRAQFDGTVHTGEFGAYMEVSLVNDGPFTIILDSRNPSGEPPQAT